jgi:hypothetical protein
MTLPLGGEGVDWSEDLGGGGGGGGCHGHRVRYEQVIMAPRG